MEQKDIDLIKDCLYFAKCEIQYFKKGYYINLHGKEKEIEKLITRIENLSGH